MINKNSYMYDAVIKNTKKVYFYKVYLGEIITSFIIETIINAI